MLYCTNESVTFRVPDAPDSLMGKTIDSLLGLDGDFDITSDSWATPNGQQELNIKSQQSTSATKLGSVSDLNFNRSLKKISSLTSKTPHSAKFPSPPHQSTAQKSSALSKETPNESLKKIPSVKSKALPSADLTSPPRQSTAEQEVFEDGLYEVKKIHACKKKKKIKEYYVEWVEKYQGQWGKNRYQWKNASTIQSNAKDEFHKECEGVEPEVSVRESCIRSYFNHKHKCSNNRKLQESKILIEGDGVWTGQKFVQYRNGNGKMSYKWFGIDDEVSCMYLFDFMMLSPLEM